VSLEPNRNGALVDLVDRILVKGVILHADLVISVSGVPLIGVNLKAAIAGLTTMVDYGMMETWDEKIRESVLTDSEEEAPLSENEKIILKTFGSHYYRGTSLSGVWRSGYLYLTNKRLFLFRKKPAKILLEIALDRIKGIATDETKCPQEKDEALLLLLENDQLDSNAVLLRTEEMSVLKRRIEEIIGCRLVKVSSSIY
jgi:hypothetical protein